MGHWKDTWDGMGLESTLCLFPIPCEYLLCDHGDIAQPLNLVFSLNWE